MLVIGTAGKDEREGHCPERLAAMYRKEINYDRETHDFAMYLDGELVGFARTYQEAEVTLDELVYELQNGPYGHQANQRPMREAA